MCKENHVDVPYPDLNFVEMFTVDIVAWSSFSLCGMFHLNVLFLRYTYTEIFFYVFHDIYWTLPVMWNIFVKQHI
jgi:hypothetical protein